MNSPPLNILVVHTAFPGDIVLVTPMLDVLRNARPHAHISVVTTPLAAGVLEHHPAVDELIRYDKKGGDRGLRSAARLAADLRRRRFDVAIVPHRSIRSAAIVRMANIPRRIGFATSAGRFLFTDRVADDRTAHEIRRNLALLGPLGVTVPDLMLPSLHPSQADQEAVDRFLAEHPSLHGDALIAVAPGSVWNTKRWPAESYGSLCGLLVASGFFPLLVGGPEDVGLCEGIRAASGQGPSVVIAAGRLSLLQSAELIARCRAAVSNDSAPMHLAVAVGTPVVGIFGATVPLFGFAPVGPHDVVVETGGLSCRPCSIHGGTVCPIATFDCMIRIDPGTVAAHVGRLAAIRREGR